VTYQEPSPARAVGWIGAVFLGIVACIVVIALFIGGFAATARYVSRQSRQQGRSQALKDAQNKVHISNIEIRNQAQRVRIAQQRAEIRKQKAIGIREAQDEIAKTLTPLYVQFEMTQALLKIAQSGRNSSVVYLPSGANGVPLVATTDPEKVTAP